MTVTSIIKSNSIFWFRYLFPGNMWVSLSLKDDPFSGY